MKAEPSLSIGEVSRRTRLSERALRLYEAEGLVAPSRSAAGRRVYSLADLRRLQQVQILRRAGYALAEIRELLKGRDFDAGEVISLHLSALRAERDGLDRSIALLEGAQARLQDGTAPDAGALCELIRLAERSLEEENWRRALSGYWSDEEQERLKTALDAAFPGQCHDQSGQDWLDLFIFMGLAPLSGPATGWLLHYMSLADLFTATGAGPLAIVAVGWMGGSIAKIGRDAPAAVPAE